VQFVCKAREEGASQDDEVCATMKRDGGLLLPALVNAAHPNGSSRCPARPYVSCPLGHGRSGAQLACPGHWEVADVSSDNQDEKGRNAVPEGRQRDFRQALLPGWRAFSTGGGYPHPCWDVRQAPRRALRYPLLAFSKGVAGRASQSPCQTRRSVIELDFAPEGPLYHRVDDRRAEALALRRSHGWSATLGPTHREGIVVNSPTHLDTAGIRRECTVFARIGRKLMECETDGLGGSRIQMQFRAAHCDPRAEKIRKVRELSAHQTVSISSPPLTPDQQVLGGRECPDALGENSKAGGFPRRSLMGDC
jgi:hypothetical protein